MLEDFEYLLGGIMKYWRSAWLRLWTNPNWTEACKLFYTHLVMCVRDWLLIQSSPVVWLVAFADFQEITSDRAASFIQWSRPEQHEGAFPHLPELKVIRTTCVRGAKVVDMMCIRVNVFVQGSVNISHWSKPEKQLCVYSLSDHMKPNQTHRWSHNKTNQKYE